MKGVFASTASNQLSITGLMFITTGEGVAHVWFITDTYSRNIVGRRDLFHMKRESALTSSRWRNGPGATIYLGCGVTRMWAANSSQFVMATVSLRLAQPAPLAAPVILPIPLWLKRETAIAKRDSSGARTAQVFEKSLWSWSWRTWDGLVPITKTAPRLG